MPIVTKLIAQLLAYSDTLLNAFVTVVGTTTIPGQCANLVAPVAQVTPCGQSLAAWMAMFSQDFGEVTLLIQTYLLTGLLAF